ncbi:MAG: M48 family metallopeptidase [Candidatus Hydrogenedentes bacterium]|nr:M48 family metallopeptidase [Candidatus Hydrogenedentota bacterium]
MQRWAACCLLAVFAFGAGHSFAQEPSPSHTTASNAEKGPVVLPPPSEKAVQFYRSGNVLWAIREVWDLLVPAIILFTGFSARMRRFAAWAGRYWFFTIAIFAAVYTLLTFAANLPLDYYAQYVRMHAYGLSNQTLGKWAQDTLIALAIEMVVTALFLWVPYLLLKKSPKRWWLYTGLLMYVFFAIVFFVKPIAIDPMFNDFGSMKDKALEQKILALADRAGIEGSDVFEVNKSEDTKAINAYVTGIFNTGRIVLWDTTIKGLSEDQLLYVMAHEMGHYVLYHAYFAIAFMGTLMLIGLYVIHRASGWVIARYGSRIGFDRLSDVASYPLIMVLLSATMFVLTPASNAYSRYNEHEADRFGLELTQDNHAAASAFVKLFQENLGYPYPHPLIKLWRSTHPPLGERVQFCNEYKPWAEGKPLVYGHLFRESETAPQ